MKTPASIDAERLDGWSRELARFSDDPAPAVRRVLYTPTDLEGRAYVHGLAKEAGLSLRVDPIGNAFYRLEGTDPSLPAVATGSHLDAIPNAGRFDGTVGVLGGIAALESIARAQAEGVDMPLCRAVAALVTGKTTVEDALTALLSRPLKEEHA